MKRVATCRTARRTDWPLAGDDGDGGDDDEGNDGGDNKEITKDMISFPIHLPNRPVGKIVVPKSITPDDCKMLEVTLQYIAIYAQQQEAAKK